MVPQSRFSAGTADRNHFHSRLIALYECRTFFGPNLDLAPSTFVLGSCGPGTTTRLTPRAHRVERRMGGAEALIWQFYRSRAARASADSAALGSSFFSQDATRVGTQFDPGSTRIPYTSPGRARPRFMRHVRGSCLSERSSANHSAWVHACLAPSPCRSTSRSLQSDGGRAPQPSMAPSGHEAIHAKPRRHTCQASPTYIRDVAPRHRSSSHQAVRPVRVAALARASI